VFLSRGIFKDFENIIFEEAAVHSKALSLQDLTSKIESWRMEEKS
jgi:hypothetical protein